MAVSPSHRIAWPRILGSQRFHHDDEMFQFPLELGEHHGFIRDCLHVHVQRIVEFRCDYVGTYDVARSELIRCAKACDRRLADLDCWHKNNQEAALKLHVEQRRIEIRSTLKPFPSWPVVDA